MFIFWYFMFHDPNMRKILWKKNLHYGSCKKIGYIPTLYFKIRVILTIWLPELTKTILFVGFVDPVLFTMLQNFGKYAPNLPTPLYFVPNNLQIYLGWWLDPPTYVGTNSQILPVFFLRHPLVIFFSFCFKSKGLLTNPKLKSKSKSTT